MALEIPPTPISEISPLVLAAISLRTSFDLSLRGLPDNPPLSKQNLLDLIKQTKKLKFFSITSFKEKNIKNIYGLKKNLKLGLCFSSVTPVEKIIKKSKLSYVKILVMEKKFLTEKKLDKIKKPKYYYTAKNKIIRKKYYNKNLIFENL